jgi:hypothetical protein
MDKLLCDTHITADNPFFRGTTMTAVENLTEDELNEELLAARAALADLKRQEEGTVNILMNKAGQISEQPGRELQ